MPNGRPIHREEIKIGLRDDASERKYAAGNGTPHKAVEHIFEIQSP